MLRRGASHANTKEGMTERVASLATASEGVGCFTFLVRLILVMLQGAARATHRKGNPSELSTAELSTGTPCDRTMTAIWKCIQPAELRCCLLAFFVLNASVTLCLCPVCINMYIDQLQQSMANIIDYESMSVGWRVREFCVSHATRPVELILVAVPPQTRVGLWLSTE